MNGDGQPRTRGQVGAGSTDVPPDPPATSPGPRTDPPPARLPVGQAGRMRRELTGSTTVMVDGVTVADPEPTFPGPPLLAVTVQMPGFIAHTLAHVLAEWPHLCDLMGAQRSEEWGLAQALHDAAQTTGESSVYDCPATRVGLARGLCTGAQAPWTATPDKPGSTPSASIPATPRR